MAFTQTSNKLLTDVELEMMTALWKLHGGTVKDVQNALSIQRKLAYTSVSTILRILEAKGVVSSQKEGRGHFYLPRLSKQEYESRSLSHLVHHLFDDEPVQLVQRLLEVKTLTKEDLESIKSLLKEGVA